MLIGALAAYYFLIGYLVGEQPGHRFEPVIVFAVAMGIHMLGVNHTVREFDPERYWVVQEGERFAVYLLDEPDPA